MSWVADMRKVLDAADTHQLTSASPQAPQPAHITIPLRPHQRTLLAAARALEDTANITALNIDEPQLLTPYGVIADRVGAGKSIIALSLLADKAPVVQSQMSVRESGATRILRYNLKERPPVLDLTPELLDISGGAAFMNST